jgi:hypothetical protein
MFIIFPKYSEMSIDRTIMLTFYKSEAILSSGLTSWKMEPLPINSPAL